ncbi:hypothetical protein [Burkholderia cepacia]|uniref:hypothetical protein n=1 Tax=Burkholderia cepacia TaxID=292 RepID=UPI00158D7699|nr:hypothetical protein [Burkholderia cepacia]
MDNVDIQSFEDEIEEIQASFVAAANHEGSEDDVEDRKRALGTRLGNQVYDCEGFNDYKLNRSSLNEVGRYIGKIGGGRHSPTLLIGNPLDKNDPIEVPIIDPTKQNPDD